MLPIDDIKSKLAACYKFLQARLANGLNWLFVGIFGWLVLHIMLIPANPYWNNAMIVVDIVVLGLLAVLIRARLDWLKRIIRILDRYRYAFFGLLFLLHTVVVASVAADPLKLGWDAATVIHTALGIANNQPNETLDLYYFMVNPNNRALLVATTIYYKLWLFAPAIDYVKQTLLLNIVLLQASLWLQYLSVSRVLSRSWAISATIVLSLFVIFTPHSRTLYTDTVGLFLVALQLFVAICLYESRQRNQIIALSALGGGLAIASYLIKPTAAIIAISLCFIVMLRLFGLLGNQKSPQPLKRNTLMGLGVFLLGAITVGGVWAGAVNPRISQDSNALRPSHYFMMGLAGACSTDGSALSLCGYGGWNYEDGHRHVPYVNKSEYDTVAQAEAWQRLRHFGLGGYINFLTMKADSIFNDGTFFVYGEGEEGRVELYYHYPGMETIRSVLNNRGTHFWVYLAATQIIWLAVLVMIVFGAIRSRHQAIQPYQLLCQLALLGLLAFLLLFESRSRYVFLYLPVFTLLAIMSLRALRDDLRS